MITFHNSVFINLEDTFEHQIYDYRHTLRSFGRSPLKTEGLLIAPNSEFTF